jgi:alkylhydroperoxidase/carboxymuconolactone decarboxylase family protein YurZ
VFHTEAARLNGATDAEIQEAVGMAAMTRQGSTVLNGMNVDKAQFRKDLDRIVRTSRQQARR